MSFYYRGLVPDILEVYQTFVKCFLDGLETGDLQDMTDRPLLYRATEVATLTGLSKQMVYQLAAEGKIPSLRIGRSVRFPAAELENWIRDLSIKSEATQ